MPVGLVAAIAERSSSRRGGLRAQTRLLNFVRAEAERSSRPRATGPHAVMHWLCVLDMSGRWDDGERTVPHQVLSRLV